MSPTRPCLRRGPRAASGGAALLLVAAALALAPAGALAQAPNPFTPLPPAAQPTQTTPTTATTTTTGSGSSGVGSNTVYIALAGAIVLLIAIGWFIARDARKVAPVPERGRNTPSGRNPDRLARQRSRAKAARQQRKRNR